MSPPVLVLLAGWGVPAAVWTPVAAALQTRFRVICLDLLGRPPGCSSLKEYICWLESRIPEKAVWLGWSLGGVVAARLAAAYPERVSRLLLVAANACFVRKPDYSTAMPEADFQSFRQDFAHAPSQAWQRFLSLQCLGAASAKADRRQLLSLCGEPLPAAADWLDIQLGWLEQEDFRPLLEDLPCPVAWLGGAEDRLVPVAASPAICPDSSVFEAAAHLPFLSEPERFSQWICSRAAGQTP